MKRIKELFEIGKGRKYGEGGENKGNTVEVDFNLQWEHKGYINEKKWRGEEGRVEVEFNGCSKLSCGRWNRVLFLKE